MSLNPPVLQTQKSTKQLVDSTSEIKKKVENEQTDEKLLPLPDFKDSAAYSSIIQFRGFTSGLSLLFSQNDINPTQQQLLVKKENTDDNDENSKNKKSKKKKSKKSKNEDSSNDNDDGNENDDFNDDNKSNTSDKSEVKKTQNSRITFEDFLQYEACSNQIEQLLLYTRKEFNMRGYGKDNLKDDLSYKQEELVINHKNIIILENFVKDQMKKYHFNIKDNEIVNLVSIPQIKKLPKILRGEGNISSFSIDIYGHCNYENERLTPFYYYKKLDEPTREKITFGLTKLILNYIESDTRNKYTKYEYPTHEQLEKSGIRQEMYPFFLNNHVKPFVLYSTTAWQNNIQLPPFKVDTRVDDYSVMIPKHIKNEYSRYMVVIFPNHKSHLLPGIWSRNVCLFDNIGRGSQLTFLDSCQSNHWGIVILNPNVNTFHVTLDLQPKKMRLTIPLHESPRRHVHTMWDFFLKPIVRETRAKLLFLGHCDGCYDIISLLHDAKDIREHVIGIAMLDYYAYNSKEWDINVLRIVEQKGAIWHSLHETNQQLHGFEPSPTKQSITTFSTSNKDHRYSPIFNQEGIVRFFKSKIELNNKSKN